MGTPKILVQQRTIIDDNIFTQGNWLIHEDGIMIVIVTKDCDDINATSFEGFYFEHRSEIANCTIYPNWSKRQFKQFTGTITITR